MAKSGGSYKPGQSGNPAGRPKGAKSKKTLMMDAFAEMLFKIYVGDPEDENTELAKDNFFTDWAKLEPKERMAMFEKIQEFRCGKHKSVDIEASVKNESPVLSAVADLLKQREK